MSEKHYRISVCRGPDCTANGANAVFTAAVDARQAERLTTRCELQRGGCYGLCHLGPNVVVREVKPGPVDPFASEDFQLTYEPEETYYWRMTPETVARMIREHVGQGRGVPELVGNPDAEGDFRKKG